MPEQQFTKYETARIIGARALQIAMDAPILLKMSQEELKELKYDSLKIAEKEFLEGVLPITIHRPTPKKRADKLRGIKEEKVSDEELAEKEKEVEKEISEEADKLGFVNAGDADESVEEEGSEEQ
ncbi:DNA-directed RNA polymerase subunit K [Candidatus Pacearchaeota archaeon]|nr:DNA-directed RNA polymerase subunit K [Candidatus Pacearchaeota archaeon]